LTQYACNNIQIEAQTFGQPENPCILLIMGLGMQLVAWPEGFCQQLVGQGFYVVRFDNRDVGLSTHFEHEGKPNLPFAIAKRTLGLNVKPIYSLNDMADDCAALLDQLGIAKAHIVGASMGGMIAQIMAFEHKDRVLSLTSIMSTTGARGLPGPNGKARSALLEPLPKGANNQTEEGISLLVQQTMRTFSVIGSPKFYPTTEAGLEQLRQRLTASVKRAYRPWGVARQLLAIIAGQERTKNLKTLAIPSLVIHGKVDPLVPFACGQATAMAIPDAKLLAIEDMGHDLPEPLWETLTAAIGTHASTGRTTRP
jgi:pimeloyl-ACP methyl ester carboxylesterase